MPRHPGFRLLVVTTMALCLTGCRTGSAFCDAYAQALTNGFSITIVGLPATSENLSVTACIAHDCRSANTTSRNQQATAEIEHPGANTTSPVTVTLAVVHGKQPVMQEFTRTVTPEYIAPLDSKKCHPGQHVIELTLDATSHR